jgi:hypothetical protein
MDGSHQAYGDWAGSNSDEQAAGGPGNPVMAKCELCGNDYDKAFEVTRGSESHVFDSFECAIQVMAPQCAHCNCKIIGHGVEAGSGKIFCCAHCARESGETRLRDRD